MASSWVSVSVGALIVTPTGQYIEFIHVHRIEYQHTLSVDFSGNCSVLYTVYRDLWFQLSTTHIYSAHYTHVPFCIFNHKHNV
jgi:hypothetical protein